LAIIKTGISKHIIIKGAQAHNFKKLDVAIPRNKLVNVIFSN
jgi:excinuclease UvrABC ATPase subunit